jgi:hypothetical protein
MDAFSLAFRVLGNARIFVMLGRCDTSCVGRQLKDQPSAKSFDGQGEN